MVPQGCCVGEDSLVVSMETKELVSNFNWFLGFLLYVVSYFLPIWQCWGVSERGRPGWCAMGDCS